MLILMFRFDTEASENDERVKQLQTRILSAINDQCWEIDPYANEYQAGLVGGPYPVGVEPISDTEAIATVTYVKAVKMDCTGMFLIPQGNGKESVEAYLQGVQTELSSIRAEIIADDSGAPHIADRTGFGQRSLSIFQALPLSRQAFNTCSQSLNAQLVDHTKIPEDVATDNGGTKINPLVVAGIGIGAVCIIGLIWVAASNR
jgi:hypothetical protein